MDNEIKKVKTGEELAEYLLQHNGKAAPYDPETREYIMGLVEKFGLSKSVLKIHHDIPERKQERN